MCEKTKILNQSHQDTIQGYQTDAAQRKEWTPAPLSARGSQRAVVCGGDRHPVALAATRVSALADGLLSLPTLEPLGTLEAHSSSLARFSARQDEPPQAPHCGLSRQPKRQKHFGGRRAWLRQRQKSQRTQAPSAVRHPPKGHPVWLWNSWSHRPTFQSRRAPDWSAAK